MAYRYCRSYCVIARQLFTESIRRGRMIYLYPVLGVAAEPEEAGLMRTFAKRDFFSSNRGFCGLSALFPGEPGGGCMVGLLIGLACGAGELFLLTRLTKLLLAGDTLKSAAIIFAKLLLFAAAAVLVLLFFKDQLIWCGVGISSVLVVGAFVINAVMRKNGKGDL